MLYTNENNYESIHRKYSLENTFQVLEIFDSIQGEGNNVGMPATFIRLAGCNLKCKFCDTMPNFNDKNILKLTIPQIVKKVHQQNVIITGGEPTLQPIEYLIDDLSSFNIFIETNGYRQIKRELIYVTCSPKFEMNYAFKCHPNELKYIVDENFNFNVIDKNYYGTIPIFLQPDFNNLKENLKKAYEIVMKHQNQNLKLGYQLHKLLDLR